MPQETFIRMQLFTLLSILIFKLIFLTINIMTTKPHKKVNYSWVEMVTVGEDTFLREVYEPKKSEQLGLPTK